jgi:hypothetical protein
MTKVRILFLSFIASIAALFFYSFTQVDLSLTLSKASLLQSLQKQFQYIGFFDRPLSTFIFVVILLGLFACYFLALYLVRKGILKLKHTKLLIFISFIGLVFSYNAFSYDLFNYIFDAKILSFYHQNPYFHKPLDYMLDPMLNFMRWTHRFYPYGPTWLVLTVPLTFIGMNIFIPTFFMFKLLMGLSLLGSSFLIYKISEKLFPSYKLFNLCFFALNPLVIVETLVSAHNDIPMIFLFLLSFYLFMENKKFKSMILFILSIGVKYSTLSFAPVFVYAWYLRSKKKQINWEKLLLFGLTLSLSTIAYASLRTTFQPWYLLVPLSIATFISRNKYIFISSILASVFAVSIYIPYVFMTDYAPEFPAVIQKIEAVGLVVSLIPLIYFLLVKKLRFD